MWKKALLFLFLLPSFILSASTLNVGIISNTEAASLTASDSLSLILSTLVPNEKLESLNYSRTQREAERGRLGEIHNAYAGEAEIPEEGEILHTPYHNSEPAFQIIQITVDEGFARDRDEEMLIHTLRLNSLDFLFVVLYEREQNVNELEAYLYTSEGVEELGYTIYLDADTRALQGFILSSLVGWLDEASTVIDLSAFPSSRYYSQEGHEIRTNNGFAVVPKTMSGVTVRRNGFYDLSIPLSLTDGMNTITGEQIEREVGSVTLTVAPYGAEATFFGLSVPQLPLSTSFQSGTALMSIFADGFARENIQLTDETNFYHVQLRPQWMIEDGRVEAAKHDMYSSMRNTLLSFALYVALGTYSSIYSDSSSWSQPIEGLAVGLSVMSLISFIRNSIAYYDTAKQVY